MLPAFCTWFSERQQPKSIELTMTGYLKFGTFEQVIESILSQQNRHALKMSSKRSQWLQNAGQSPYPSERRVNSLLRIPK